MFQPGMGTLNKSMNYVRIFRRGRNSNCGPMMWGMWLVIVVSVSATRLTEGWTLRRGDGQGPAAVEALVPGTVLGSLAHAGLYPQLLQGQRLSQVPTEQFDGPWLYETSVQSPQKREALIQLQGVSYRASATGRGCLSMATL